MTAQIVDIAGEPRSLRLHRGFMVVAEQKRELGRLDLDGVLVLIVSSKGATLTTALLCECASRHIPVILCNRTYQVESIALPVNSHFDQNRRHEVQFHAKKGLKNRLWQQIVRAKISIQAQLLEQLNATGTRRLKRLASEVRAGDTENLEAQAARIYWPCLFGTAFRRGDEADPLNGILNYGYAVMRGAMLKAVLATGLHPSCGVHHTNRHNPYCLVDDLLEPYRPVVDQIVLRLKQNDVTEVTPETKRILSSLVTADVVHAGQMSPLFQDMGRFARSVWDCFDGRKEKLGTSGLLSRLELEGMVGHC